MPIGKNALKRVENNGYSKVETQAPDMENSTVIANIDQQVVEKILAPVEKKAKARGRKKAAPVEAVAEVPVEKPAKRKYTKRKVAVAEAPVVEAKPAKRKYVKRRPEEKKAEGKAGFDRVEVGQGMPYYLL